MTLTKRLNEILNDPIQRGSGWQIQNPTLASQDPQGLNGRCVCDSCGWEGLEEETDDGKCPECGSQFLSFEDPEESMQDDADTGANQDAFMAKDPYKDDHPKFGVGDIVTHKNDSYQAGQKLIVLEVDPPDGYFITVRNPKYGKTITGHASSFKLISKAKPITDPSRLLTNSRNPYEDDQTDPKLPPYAASEDPYRREEFKFKEGDKVAVISDKRTDFAGEIGKVISRQSKFGPSTTYRVQFEGGVQEIFTEDELSAGLSTADPTGQAVGQFDDPQRPVDYGI